MNPYLRFSIITLFFTTCIIYVLVPRKVPETQEVSINGVLLIPENAPPLKDLLSESEGGPHQEFISAEMCLTCHREEKVNKTLGKIPKIPHAYKNNCLECHKIP